MAGWLLGKLVDALASYPVFSAGLNCSPKECLGGCSSGLTPNIWSTNGGKFNQTRARVRNFSLKASRKNAPPDQHLSDNRKEEFLSKAV